VVLYTVYNSRNGRNTASLVGGDSTVYRRGISHKHKDNALLFGTELLGETFRKGEKVMHLHLVSTQNMVPAGKSIECEDHKAQDGYLERPAPDSCEQPMDERAARVEALRLQVRAGTYQIDSHAIAEILLKKQINFT
jgi:anti-sigma28 factor (negative regulator of flagellin synthesis)